MLSVSVINGHKNTFQLLRVTNVVRQFYMGMVQAVLLHWWVV